MKTTAFVLLILLIRVGLLNCCHPRDFPGAAGIQVVGLRPVVLSPAQQALLNNPFLGMSSVQLASLLGTNPALLANPLFLQAFLPSLNTVQLTNFLLQNPALLNNPQFDMSLVSSLNPAQLGALINANPALLSYPSLIQALAKLPSAQLVSLLNSATLSPAVINFLLNNPQIRQALTTNNAGGSPTSSIQQQQNPMSNVPPPQTAAGGSSDIQKQ